MGARVCGVPDGVPPGAEGECEYSDMGDRVRNGGADGWCRGGRRMDPADGEEAGTGDEDGDASGHQSGKGREKERVVILTGLKTGGVWRCLYRDFFPSIHKSIPILIPMFLDF